MKLLFRLFFAGMLVACFFASCKKSAKNPTPTITNDLTSQGMKYTINGDTSSLPLCYTYDVATNNAATSTIIQGYSLVNGALGTKLLKLSVLHTSSLKAGDTFTGLSNDVIVGVTGFYTADGGVASFTSQSSNPQGTLTITEITSDHIKGTFTMKLFKPDDTNGTTVIYTITQGVFYAKVTKQA